MKGELAKTKHHNTVVKRAAAPGGFTLWVSVCSKTIARVTTERVCTWSALLEELVEVQRGGSGVGLLGSRRRGGRLLCFLHRIFKRRAGVGPEGGVMWAAKQQGTVRPKSNAGPQNIWPHFIHLCLVLVLVCGSRSWGGSVRKDMLNEQGRVRPLVLFELLQMRTSDFSVELQALLSCGCSGSSVFLTILVNTAGCWEWTVEYLCYMHCVCTGQCAFTVIFQH